MVIGPSFISDTFISSPKIPVSTFIFLLFSLLLNSLYSTLASLLVNALVYDGLLPLDASAYRVNWLIDNILPDISNKLLSFAVS